MIRIVKTGILLFFAIFLTACATTGDKDPSLGNYDMREQPTDSSKAASQ